MTFCLACHHALISSSSRGTVKLLRQSYIALVFLFYANNRLLPLCRCGGLRYQSDAGNQTWCLVYPSARLSRATSMESSCDHPRALCGCWLAATTISLLLFSLFLCLFLALAPQLFHHIISRIGLVVSAFITAFGGRPFAPTFAGTCGGWAVALVVLVFA